MLPLFDNAPGEMPVRLVGERVFYECPHCGGEMSQDAEEETLVELRADPACCFCRAEFAGLSFSQWRLLPMKERRANRPPTEWRSARARVPQEA